MQSSANAAWKGVHSHCASWAGVLLGPYHKTVSVLSAAVCVVCKSHIAGLHLCCTAAYKHLSLTKMAWQGFCHSMQSQHVCRTSADKAVDDQQHTKAWQRRIGYTVYGRGTAHIYLERCCLDLNPRILTVAAAKFMKMVSIAAGAAIQISHFGGAQA